MLATTTSIWAQPSGSSTLYMGIGATLLVGFLILIGMMYAPVRLRRPIVATFTFLAGLIFVLVWLWPAPVNRAPDELPAPNNMVDSFGFWLSDAVGRIGSVASILTAFLLGLGVFSLLRLHFGKIARRQADWPFSIVLLLSILAMVVVGYWDWYVKDFASEGADFSVRSNWSGITYAQDLLFDGLLQKMDAAMFSVIAFFILSAAYRAFRIRSIEATILLSTALIVMLSLLALVELASTNMINGMAGNDPASPLQNLKLSEIAQFIRTAFQSPGIRAIDFGIGVGALAMGLRLWLSLERGGASS